MDRRHGVAAIVAGAAMIGAQAACGSGRTSTAASPACTPLHVTAQRSSLAENDLQTPGFKLDVGTQPVGIALDRDGASAWILGTGSNSVIHVAPDGAATTYTLPASDLGLNLSQASDGTVWVPEHYRNAIAAIAPDGSARECHVPRNAAEPISTAASPDGSVWVSEAHGEAIAKLADGRFTEYPIGVAGAEVLAAADGGAWFTVNGATILGRITASSEVRKIPIGGSGVTLGMLAMPDGSVWVADFGGDRVVHVALDGAYTEWKTPTGAKPQSLAVGPGGAVWLTESGANRLAVIKESQVVERYTTGAWPDHMVVTSDGWAWVTEYYQDRVARLQLPAV